MPNEPAQPLDIRQQLATLLAEQRQLAERLHGDQARFRRLARSVWSVQEEERRRLARDLHDGVGHGLTTIIHLLTNALDALAQDSGNDQVRAFVDKARDVGRSTLADTRAMSRLLRPQILDDLGLAPALQWLARAMREADGIEVELDLQVPAHEDTDSEQAILLFRVAQEALSNSARHSGARRVALRLAHSAREWSLEIADDGHGCNLAVALAASAHGTGSGLGGMRDRVALFGGTLRFESEPGRGFRVLMHLPRVPEDTP